MERFLVEVRRGLVTNEKKDTSRVGYWVPLQSLPRHIAARFGADKTSARNSLGFDVGKAQWRDMKNARVQDSRFCHASIVQFEDGTVSIALLDF